MRLLLALLVLPVAEIAVFILVGGRIGLWATLGLVLLAGVAGVALLRGAGTDAAARIRTAMARDEDPSSELVRMAMRFVAGMLLVLPGLLTDLAALVLLLPGVQRAAFALLRRRARMSGVVIDASVTGMAPGSRHPADRVIEGEFRDVTAPGPRQAPAARAGPKSDAPRGQHH